MHWKIALVLLAGLLVGAVSTESVFAQGGTGRETGSSNTTKPPTSKRPVNVPKPVSRPA